METTERKKPAAFLARLTAGTAIRRIWVYLALTFVVSWTLWLPAIRYKENPVFLNLGSGPAIVAVLMVACEEREAGRGGTARLKTFLLLVPLLWLIVLLGTSWATGIHWPLRRNLWLHRFDADSGVDCLRRMVRRPGRMRINEDGRATAQLVMAGSGAPGLSTIAAHLGRGCTPPSPAGD